jgi:hypothetical protein
MTDTVHILLWRESDGSASGVVRAYCTKERADQDLELLKSAEGGKIFEMVSLPLLDGSVTIQQKFGAYPPGVRDGARPA